MPGIYLHIPFCRQACHYCDFYFSIAINKKSEFVDMIIREIELRKNYLPNDVIESIYFGGGTPSLLSGDEIKRIIEKIESTFVVSDDIEITFEANPDDLTKSHLLNIINAGINRLSIGIQSFNNDDLILMNRVHDASEAVNSIQLAKELGFKNINIDLIYGIPGMTMERWEQNLEKAFNLGIQHLSAYHLTIEPGTVLAHKIKKGKLVEQPEKESIDEFFLLKRIAGNYNFDHYEISNFALKGYFSKHNLSYWKSKKYLGLGPSAHSYDLDSRQWNFRSLGKYLKAISNQEIFYEREELSITDRYNEYILTSLRTKWGIDLLYIGKIFGDTYQKYLEKQAIIYLDDRYLKLEGNSLILTESGMLLADKIISDLFQT